MSEAAIQFGQWLVIEISKPGTEQSLLLLLSTDDLIQLSCFLIAPYIKRARVQYQYRRILICK